MPSRSYAYFYVTVGDVFNWQGERFSCRVRVLDNGNILPISILGQAAAQAKISGHKEASDILRTIDHHHFQDDPDCPVQIHPIKNSSRPHPVR
jgi:hypothetical protein